MKSLILFISIFSFSFVIAQSSEDPVAWKMELNKVSENEQEVCISAKILDGWQLYSNDFDPNLGPIITEFKYTENETFELIRGTVPQNSHRKYDDLWGGEYSYFENKGLFIQKIKQLTESPQIEVGVSYQICNTEDGKCIPFEVTLKN